MFINNLIDVLIKFIYILLIYFVKTTKNIVIILINKGKQNE